VARPAPGFIRRELGQFRAHRVAGRTVPGGSSQR
jgi:hypothetical protein